MNESFSTKNPYGAITFSYKSCSTVKLAGQVTNKTSGQFLLAIFLEVAKIKKKLTSWHMVNNYILKSNGKYECTISIIIFLCLWFFFTILPILTYYFSLHTLIKLNRKNIDKILKLFSNILAIHNSKTWCLIVFVLV